MNPLDVVLISGGFTLVGTFLAWLLARRDKKDDRKHTTHSPTPPSTQEVWARLDRTEKVANSAVILLEDTADQWPVDSDPVFPKRHVMILSEAGYMPSRWDPLP